MTIYFMTFFISTICAWCASFFRKKDKRSFFVLFSIGAVIIPSALAGMRAVGVGTDTTVYIGPYFEKACASTNVFSYISDNSLEPLYLLVNFAVSRFTSSVNVLYFVLQLLIMTFVYLACLESKKDKYYLPYLFFMVLSFNRSLNMCRQSIAIAITLFACYRYAFNRKFIKFMIFILIGFGFHKTALLVIPVYFINILLGNKNFKKINKILIIIGLILCYVAFPVVGQMLIDNNIIESRYEYYITSGNSNLLPIETLFEVFVFLMVVLFYKKLIKKDKLNDTLVIILLVGFVLYFLGNYANYAQRIAYYFEYFNIFIFAEIIELFKGKRQQLLVGLVLTIIICTYSYIYYDKNKYHETVPYYTNGSIR